MQSSPPRAAYIHVPFCLHRCGYCNFTLVTGRDDLIGPYLEALGLELQQLMEPREVDTLYFGGGTPTYLEPQQLSRLMELVLKWLPLALGHEWTVEANPADLDPQRMEVLAKWGVNRLSLGAQSFRSEKLALLERNHQAKHIAEAVEFARAAGMRVSLDLIFASPGETLEQWQCDLDEALDLDPEHISTYGLTYEQGTSFWIRREQHELVQADEELEREMYLSAIDRLTHKGFEHYEISNFARPGQRSRHNEVYWSGSGYFAVGPGAARYVDGVRETNHRSTTTYLNRVLKGESPVAERETLDRLQRARELLVFGLRRLVGVDRRDFNRLTGVEIDQLVGREIQRLVELGMLDDDGQRICLTRAGLLVSDNIWPEIL